ncbi:TPA: RepB family plasmid replication initiator protein [Clostridioides difficile]
MIQFKKVLDDGSTDWGTYRFIAGKIYNDKSDTFKIEIPNTVYRLLMDYIDGYTPIKLQIWLSLKNTYAQRFYDLLRMWSYTKKTVNYRVDDLKTYLQIEDKYSEFKDFKKELLCQQ